MNETPRTRELPTAAPGSAGAPTAEEWLASPEANQPVVEGVRPITQDPAFDASIDAEPASSEVVDEEGPA